MDNNDVNEFAAQVLSLQAKLMAYGIKADGIKTRVEAMLVANRCSDDAGYDETEFEAMAALQSEIAVVVNGISKDLLTLIDSLDLTEFDSEGKEAT